MGCCKQEANQVMSAQNVNEGDALRSGLSVGHLAASTPNTARHFRKKSCIQDRPLRQTSLQHISAGKRTRVQTMKSNDVEEEEEEESDSDDTR